MLQMLLLTCDAQLVEMIRLFFANHRQNVSRPEEEIITRVRRRHRSFHRSESAAAASASLMKRSRARSRSSTLWTVRVGEASVAPSVGNISRLDVLNIIRMRWQWQRRKGLLPGINDLLVLVLVLLLVRWIVRWILSVKVVYTVELWRITLRLNRRICWWTVVVVAVVRTWSLRSDVVVLFKVSQPILSQGKIVLVVKIEVWMFLLQNNQYLFSNLNVF